MLVESTPGNNSRNSEIMVHNDFTYLFDLLKAN